MLNTMQGRKPIRFAAPVPAGTTIAAPVVLYSELITMNSMIEDFGWRIYKGPNLTVRIYLDIIDANDQVRQLFQQIGKEYIDGDNDSPEFKRIQIPLYKGDRIRMRVTNSAAYAYNVGINFVVDFGSSSVPAR